MTATACSAPSTIAQSLEGFSVRLACERGADHDGMHLGAGLYWGDLDAVQAAAWQEGVDTTLQYAKRADNGITLTLDHPNPYDPPQPEHRCAVEEFFDTVETYPVIPEFAETMAMLRRMHLQEVTS